MFEKMFRRPGKLGKFPGAKVGDRVYACESLGQAIEEATIIALDERGHAILVDDRGEVFWGYGRFFRSLEEVLLSGAEGEAEYARKMLDRVASLKYDIENRRDLSRWKLGVDEDGKPNRGSQIDKWFDDDMKEDK